MLITKSMKFPKLYSTDGKPKDKVEVVAKFFTPDSQCTWYAVEFDGDDTFYGWCDIGMGGELGYFSKSELESLRGNLGLPVERDRYFKGTLAQVMQGEVS